MLMELNVPQMLIALPTTIATSSTSVSQELQELMAPSLMVLAMPMAHAPLDNTAMSSRDALTEPLKTMLPFQMELAMLTALALQDNTAMNLRDVSMASQE